MDLTRYTKKMWRNVQIVMSGIHPKQKYKFSLLFLFELFFREIVNNKVLTAYYKRNYESKHVNKFIYHH